MENKIMQALEKEFARYLPPDGERVEAGDLSSQVETGLQRGRQLRAVALNFAIRQMANFFCSKTNEMAHYLSGALSRRLLYLKSTTPGDSRKR
ncbi:MAG: hypothetical protein P8179_20730 [Candidatus Thiodiazotropha sp.]|jgi:hypothetical protein